MSLHDLQITAHRTSGSTPSVTLSHGDYSINITGMDQLKHLISALDEARIHLERSEFERVVPLR